jgi:hypothetical protein
MHIIDSIGKKFILVVVELNSIKQNHNGEILIEITKNVCVATLVSLTTHEANVELSLLHSETKTFGGWSGVKKGNKEATSLQEKHQGQTDRLILQYSIVKSDKNI